MPPENPETSDEDAGSTFLYDTGVDEPTTTIIEAVASISGTDEMALAPLDRVVNTDALNALFRDTNDTGEFYRSASVDSDAELQVTFEYEEYVVTVKRGQISVEA